MCVISARLYGGVYVCTRHRYCCNICVLCPRRRPCNTYARAACVYDTHVSSHVDSRTAHCTNVLCAVRTDVVVALRNAWPNYEFGRVEGRRQRYSVFSIGKKKCRVRPSCNVYSYTAHTVIAESRFCTRLCVISCTMIICTSCTISVVFFPSVSKVNPFHG